MLSTRRITAPTELPVSVADARRHVREDSDEAGVVLLGMIQAATAYLEGWSGVLGRCLVHQTWEDTYEEFSSVQGLALRPVQSIVAVKYDDTTGAEQTVDPALYQLLGDKLYLRPGKSWPTLGNTIGPVRVRYVAGYGDAAAVPAPIKSAILLMVGDWYEHRETAVVGASATSVPIAASVDALIAPFRNFGVMA